LFETNGATAGSFGDVFAYGLPLDYYQRLPSRFGVVDAKQVELLARRYLDPAAMIVVAVGDRKRLERALQPLGLGSIEVWPVTGVLF